MSSKYKFIDREGVYFVTSTVVGWGRCFYQGYLPGDFTKQFSVLLGERGLCIHAWVLMLNHFHMICSCKETDPGMVTKNIKRFTAIRIVDTIFKNAQESRKEWLLNLFEAHGRKNKSNHRYQFWQHENHPILLQGQEMYRQRLNYLHENPVRAGFVHSPEHWVYSSAIDYYVINGRGVLNLEVLD